MSKELGIHTVIVDGDFRSFKAAFSRSVLGVTFRKFKRKKSEFYQHRVHNEAVTQHVQKWLYEYLLTQTNLKNISDFKLKTDMTIVWDKTGKIGAMKGIAVDIYLKVGELTVQRMEFRRESETISIDLFYSDIDASSQKIRDILPKLIESMGSENFNYRKHDFLTEKGRQLAQAYHVERVPTVIINAENLIENPDERTLRQEIEKAFSPTLAVTRPDFSIEPIKKPVAELLAKSNIITFQQIKNPK